MFLLSVYKKFISLEVFHFRELKKMSKERVLQLLLLASILHKAAGEKNETRTGGQPVIWDSASCEIGFYDNRTVKISLKGCGFKDGDFSSTIFHGLSSLKQLDISDNRFTTLPPKLFQGLNELVELDLSGNELLTLQEGIFEDLSSLNVLHLQKNQLREIQKGLFRNQLTLEALDLSFNLLESLPDMLFSELNNLTFLYLHRNELKLMQGKVFKGIYNLRVITLQHNRLSRLPPQIFKDLVQLYNLSMDNNPLSVLPATTFITLPSLEYLSLRHCNLIILAAEQFKNLQSLNTLYLDGNSLKTLPGAIFKDLSSLKTLSLEYNTLESLHKQTFHGLFSLKTLSLKSNELKWLEPGSLKDLPALESLSISFNHFKELPENIFGNLSRLEFLTLRYNGLRVLPKGFCHGLKALMTLDLGFSDLRSLTGDQLQGCTNLRRVTIAVSGIRTISMEAVRNMTLLTYIDFSSSYLSFLPERAFHTLSHLQHLDLSHNGFPHLHKNTFSNLTALSYLNLQDSELGILPTHLFCGLHNLQVLELSHSGSGIPLELPGDIFRGLSSLRKLYLGSSRLRLLDENIFQDLESLEILAVNDNFLQTLPAGLFEKTISLSQIHLMSNRLLQLPDNIFDRLSNVRYIDLHGNFLRVIPRRLFYNLSRLEEVYLYDNMLTHLSRETFQFTNITSLRLEGNNLQVLPEKLFHGLPLKSLNLKYNRITQLPKQIFQGSSAVSHLSLEANTLQKLDLVFRGLTKLLVLDLRHNSLSNLSERLFEDLNSLKTLQLSNNVLVTLPPLIFQRLQHLSYLGLTENNINYLERGIFQNLKHLSEISLRSNDLRSFDICIFTQRLKILDLSLNQLDSISCLSSERPQKHLPIFLKLNLASNLLGDFPRFIINMLEDSSHIDLSNNQLKDLSFLDLINSDWKNTAAKFPYKNVLLYNDNFVTSLSVDMSEQPTLPGKVISMFNQFRIDMSGNPLNCDCTAGLFYQIMHRINETQFDELDLKYMKTWICSEPLDVTGKALLEVPFTDLRCNFNVSGCPRRCECWSYSYFVGQVLVNCKKKGLTEVPSTMPKRIDVLHIEMNLIDSLENLGVRNYISQLSRLYLQKNKLQKIPDYLVPALIHLDELSLSDNLLTAIPHGFRYMNHTKLSLGGNVLTCDCHARWLLSWIRSYEHNIIDVDNIFCDSGEQLMMKNPYDFICELSQEEIALIAMAATFAMLVLAAILVYRYRVEIKIVLFTRFNWHPFDKPEENDVLDKLYDAFVSYSGHDVQWVLNTLKPRLETPERAYRLCMNDRDFLPGEEITTNILNGVKFSRKMIMILTRSFLASEWCRFEFITAHLRVLKGRTNYLIVILFDHIKVSELDEDLQAYLKTNTYLYYADKWFWDKLMYAMPEKSLCTLRGHHYPEGGFRTLCPTPLSLAAIHNIRAREDEVQLIRDAAEREVQ